MANPGSIDALKKAFNDGFEAFNKVEQNERGYWINPPNPHPPKSLLFKEWQRGMDKAFWIQQSKKEKAEVLSGIKRT